MTAKQEAIPQMLATELSLLWAAHHAVGLKGYMCLYAPETQVPFRTSHPGTTLWFGPDDTEEVIKKILYHHNNGQLPNTPLYSIPSFIHKAPMEVISL